MTDPNFPDVDPDDPFEAEDEETLGDGSDDASGDSRAFGTAPGSLTSLRIRKRVPAPRTTSSTPRATAAPGIASPGSAAPASTIPVSAIRPERPADDRQPPVDRDLSPRAAPVMRPDAREYRPEMPTSRSAGPVNEPAHSGPAQPRPAAPTESGAGSDTGSSAPPGGRAQATNLVTYWTQLKGSRRYPRVTDLDHGHIAATWPNSILMRCRAGSKALQPDRVFSTGDGASGGLSSLRTSARINLSPMMLQWLLGLAGEVVGTGRPMQDEEEFPSSRRSARYRAVALPFSQGDNAVDHVLCHVSPAN